MASGSKPIKTRISSCCSWQHLASSCWRSRTCAWAARKYAAHQFRCFCSTQTCKMRKTHFQRPSLSIPNGERKQGGTAEFAPHPQCQIPAFSMVCRNMSLRSLVPTPAARRTTVAAREPAHIFAQWASLHKHDMNRHDVAWGNNALLDIYHVFISYQRECD